MNNACKLALGILVSASSVTALAQPSSWIGASTSSVKVFKRYEGDNVIASAVVTLKDENKNTKSFKLSCDTATNYAHTSFNCRAGDDVTQVQGLEFYFSTLLSRDGMFQTAMLTRTSGRGAAQQQGGCLKQEENRVDSLVLHCDSFSSLEEQVQGPLVSIEHKEENVFIATIKNGWRHSDTKVSCSRDTFARRGFITCSFPTEGVEHGGWYSNRVVLAEPSDQHSGPAYYEVNTAGYARISGVCWYSNKTRIDCSF